MQIENVRKRATLRRKSQKRRYPNKKGKDRESSPIHETQAIEVEETPSDEGTTEIEETPSDEGTTEIGELPSDNGTSETEEPRSGGGKSETEKLPSEDRKSETEDLPSVNGTSEIGTSCSGWCVSLFDTSLTNL